MIRVPAVWLWDPKHQGYIGPEEVLVGYGRLQVEHDIKHVLWVTLYRSFETLTDKEMCVRGGFVEDGFTTHG